MATIIVHNNDLLEYLHNEYEKLQKLDEYLELNLDSKYIKKGYLYIPQGKYTQEHSEVVLNLLNQHAQGPECRRKDICKSLLEVNL